MMKIFAPNRKNSSCQEMGRQYLRCLSMGTSFWVLGTGYWVLGIGYWVLGLKVIGLNTYWDDSGNYREVKGNPLGNG